MSMYLSNEIDKVRGDLETLLGFPSVWAVDSGFALPSASMSASMSEAASISVSISEEDVSSKAKLLASGVVGETSRA